MQNRKTEDNAEPKIITHFCITEWKSSEWWHLSAAKVKARDHMLQVLYRQASEAPDYGVKFHSKENPKILWFFDPIIKNKELEWNKELPLE